MAIHFRCSNPDCQKPMRAPDGTEGKKASCPFCNTVQIIPTPAGEAESEDAFGPIDFSDEAFAEELSQEEEEPRSCAECNADLPPGANVCPACGHIAGTEELTDQFAGGPALGEHAVEKTKGHNALFLALAGVGAVCAIIAIAFILMGDKTDNGPATTRPPKVHKVKPKIDKAQLNDVEPARPQLDERTLNLRNKSVNMMQQISVKLFAAAVNNNGKFPDDIQKQISSSMMRSPGNTRLSFQYLPGQSLDDPEKIVMYDPFSYQGTYVAMQAGGEVEIFDTLEEREKRLDEQMVD